MTARMKLCLKAATTLSDADLADLADSIETYVKAGVATPEAETLAIADLLAQVAAERTQTVSALREQFPELFQAQQAQDDDEDEKPVEEVPATPPNGDATSDVEPAVVAPPVQEPTAAAPKSITDVGEKIGGARKDRAVAVGSKTQKEASDVPGWKRRYEVSKIEASHRAEEVGRWVVRDTRKEDRLGQARQVGRDSFATKEEAEAAIPLFEVARNHVARLTSDNKYEIWRNVTDRKRVKVVGEIFETRDAAMSYMALNATDIIELKTSFGEEILPRPETVKRIGAARRTEDAKGEDFVAVFGFRAIEFGNWNAQDERQAVMNHAYDALLDLAEVMGIPPRAIGLNGELALAFGARGHGLQGARAHYEPDYGVINLTKMKGAGSLAHEWFHATDHYFGRQDGKAAAERIKNKRGDSVFDAKGVEKDLASFGFGAKQSGVREELRAAYNKVISTMQTKAVEFVEDTQRADKFVQVTRDDVANRLQRIRENLASELPSYVKRKNKPASAEQLASFDVLADKLIAGEFLNLEFRANERKGGRGASTYRQSNDALDQISAIYKDVRGRSGFDSTNRSGEMDDLGGALRRYGARLELLAQAESAEVKTKKVPTEFMMEAKSIDQGRASDYWATPHEMAARAFESYIQDKIAAQGNQSDFLAYGTNTVIPTPWGWKRPYPHGKERQAINASFDEFVKVLDTQETDRGVMMFSVAGRGIRAAGIPRGVPQVTSFRNAEPLKAHSRYTEAKAGDAASAVQLVTDLVEAETLAEAAAFGKATYVYPHAEEASGRNKLPAALAALYADHTGNAFTSVVQSNRTYHTGAKLMDRMLARPKFEGGIEPGRYVVVDDVTTSGNTLAELANHVQNNGGEVVGVLTLTDATRTKTMTADRKVLALVKERFGNAIEEIFGITPDSLTAVEAGYFANFRDVDALRVRVATARRERNQRLHAKGISESGASVESPESGRAGVAADGNNRSVAVDEGATEGPAEGVARGLPVADVQRLVRERAGNWRLKVEVVATAADLPGGVAPGLTEGAYLDGQGIYLVASNLPNRKRVLEVLAHEAIGHYGFETVMGRELGTVLSQVREMERFGNKDVRAAAQRVDETQPGLDRTQRAKEIVAVLAERGIQNSLVKRVLAAVRAFLARLGFRIEYGLPELARAMRAAETALTRPTAARAAGSLGGLSPSYSFAEDDPARFSAAGGQTRDATEEEAEALQEFGTAPLSKVDAARAFNAGDDVFVMHEQSEEASLVLSASVLDAYTLDQMMILPKARRPASSFSVAVDPAQDPRLAGTLVVDKKGEPLRVYRGEHGEVDDLSTRHGALTFAADPETARVYSERPNDRGADPVAKKPRVIEAYLSLKNPAFRKVDDPFIQADELVKLFGEKFARTLVEQNVEGIEGTDTWMDWDPDFKGSPVDAFDQQPEKRDALYFFAFRVFDNPEAVKRLKAKGYDGAIYAAYGTHSESFDGDDVEYRVFDKSHVVLAKPGGRSYSVGASRPPSSAAARQNDLVDRNEYLNRLGKLIGREDAPPVQVVPRLRKLLRDAESGVPVNEDEVKRLLDDLERRNARQADAKIAPLTRGPLWIRERLTREMRTGANPGAAELALWFLEQNPSMAEGLAISFRAKGDSAGTYDEVRRLATIIEGASRGTAVHEILHHTERMMPDGVQAGIRAEWARQLKKQLNFAAENNLEPLVRAVTLAMAGRSEDVGTLIEAIKTGEIPFDFYQFVNPSEFWAVNGTRLMMERADAPGWVAQARRWVQGLIEKLKEIFGLSSDAPVLRALDAILKSDGGYLQSLGLAGGMMQAINEPDAGSLKALEELAKVDDLFQIPRSDATTVEALAAELSAKGLLPGAKVKSSRIVNETLYTITYEGDDGQERDAKLWVRKSTPSSMYAMEIVEGEAGQMQVGRPGDNPEDVPDGIGEVYLDVSRLNEGSRGSRLYHLASTFAHNTGRIFIGDPSGLSNGAMRRRLDNMISTALKYGTTKHIAPHPDQISGRAGVPGFRWTYGDHVGNIERMIKAAVAASGDDGRLVQFRASDGTFRDSAGAVLGKRGLQAIVNGRPARPGAGGITTLARNAILRSLVSGEGAAGEGGGAERVAPLVGLVHVGTEHRSGAARRIFYSIDPLAGEQGREDGTPTEKANSRKQAADALSAPPIAPPSWAGPLFRDMGAFSKYAVHPRTIAAFDKAFTPVYRVAEAQVESRDRIASELAKKVQDYSDLPTAGKARVNAVLELGRLKGEVLSGNKMSMTNEGEAAQLSSDGEVITLSDAEKTAYLGVRQMLNDALDRFRDQALTDFGIDPSQFQGRGISQRLIAAADAIPPGFSGNSRAQTLRTAAAMVDEIEQARRTGYVPFSRFGDIVVTVKDANNATLWASKVDSTGMMNAARKKFGAAVVTGIPAVKAEMARLAEQFRGQDVTIGAFQAQSLTEGQADVRMADIDMLAEVANINNQQWDAVREQLERAVKAKGFRKHFFGAANTPGYSADFERSLSDYMLGMAGYLARREALPKWDSAIGSIPTQKANLIAYAKSYRDYVQNPTEEWHRLRQFGFLWYLAGVPATALVNLTQVDLLTAPYLMQFAGAGRVELEVQKARLETAAMVTVAMDVFDPAKAPADVREDLQKAWDEGFFVPLNTYELMGTAYTGSKGQRSFDRAFRTLTDAVAIAFTAAERHNRIASFIAAHRIARRPGMQAKVQAQLAGNALARDTLGDWSPKDFAQWVIDETHFRMGKVNRPTITRGVGAPLMQFKGFTMQSLERWITMAMLQGPQGKKAMLISLGLMWLLSGFWGLPGADDWRDLFEKMYKALAGKDFDTETKLREAVVELTGSPQIAQAFSKGATFPAGLDLSGRMGMGNIAPDTPLAMLGIPGDLFISRPSKFMERASQDNWAGAFAELAPNFIKNPMQAASWNSRGVSTMRGKRVLTPDQLDGTDIAMRGMGFQPSKVTNERERQFAERRAASSVDEMRRDYYTRVSQALADERRASDKGDETAAADAREKVLKAYADLAKHNETALEPERIDLNNSTLRRKIAEDLNGPGAVRRQARSRAEEIRDIYGAPR